MTFLHSGHWLRTALLGTATVLMCAYCWKAVTVLASDEVGVVERLGKVRALPLQPGFHFRPLWPIERLYPLKTATAYIMSVGYKILDDVAGKPPAPEESEWLTSDTNIINLQLVLQFSIKDPIQFLFQTEEAPFVLRKVAESELTGLLGKLPVDEILTRGKAAIAEQLLSKVQKRLDDYELGITVLGVNVKTAEPPARMGVKEAFQDVADAKADRSRLINEAHGYANDLLPRAGGEAEAMVLRASGDKEARINEATGQADRFLNVYEQYRKSPETTARRLYLETVETVLPPVRTYWTGSHDGKEPVPLTVVQTP